MPWTKVGASVTFLGINESSFSDPLPLFGEPSVSGNQLLFTPTAFSSYSAGLAADVTDSHLTMTITANSSIKSVLFTEYGDYTLVGSTSAGASVSTPVTLTINHDSNLTMSTYLTYSVMPSGSSTYVPHSGTFSLPADAGTGVFWKGALNADISGFLASKGYSAPATSIYLSLDNSVATWSTSGAVAGISKKLFSLQADPVPEPSALVLMAACGVVAAGFGWRRRKAAVSAALSP